MQTKEAVEEVPSGDENQGFIPDTDLHLNIESTTDLNKDETTHYSETSEDSQVNYILLE